MKKMIVCLLLVLTTAIKVFAQDAIEVYPTNWWVGMKNPKLQVMLHGAGVGNAAGFSISYPGARIGHLAGPWHTGTSFSF